VLFRSIYRIGDQYWQFSATPGGDRLTVRPCLRPLGTLQIGPGGRRIKDMTVRGTLHSKDTFVALGALSEQGLWEGTQTCQIPEGDYQPWIVRIQYGPLGITIAWLGRGDGTGEEICRSDTYGIRIRKDRPFVLDFSEKPKVLFSSPGPAARVRRGDAMEIQAWLTDPKLGILIEDMYSMPHERLSWVYTLLAPGLLIAGVLWLVAPRIPRTLRPVGWIPIAASVLILALLGFDRLVANKMAKTYGQRPHKLEAGAVVTRANGQVVGRGEFPWTWRIPADLDLKGDEEVFTIKATFETEELYGTVKATRQVTVCR
jgi:hypothetical protein